MDKKMKEEDLLDDDDEMEEEEEEDEIVDEDDLDDGDIPSDISTGIGDETPIGKIAWDESLSVDIPEIDALQQNVFTLLNDLIDCKETSCGAKDGATIVAKLIDESRIFFAKEETRLRRCGYPDCDTHAKEHRQFIKSLINIRRQVSDDKKNLTYELIKNLREWLVTHILGNDHLYVPFVRVNRYIDESRQKR